MLLFRSEEHLEGWLASRGLGRGATLTPDQQWRLANAWYSDRMDPQWRRRTPEEAEQTFTGIGLTGDFWRLNR
jgi:hypothetical protein